VRDRHEYNIQVFIIPIIISGFQLFLFLYVNKQFVNTLLRFINNHIYMKNLNKQAIWLQRENLLKNFSKDKKKKKNPSRLAKLRTNNFH
jgi:uncharacterized protein YlbG (UPF0298 family)